MKDYLLLMIFYIIRYDTFIKDKYYIEVYKRNVGYEEENAFRMNTIINYLLKNNYLFI